MNRKNSAVAYQNFATDFVDHDEPDGESVGPEPAKRMMENVYIKYPDIHMTVEDAIAEGDKVMVRNVWRGTDSSTGHDAVLSAIGTSGSSVEVIADAARSLIEGLSQVGIRRLVVVGGAGVLEVEPGVEFVDSPNFFEEYRPLGLVHRQAYNLYQTSDLDWTFVCPAAEIAPGERTGKFQVGADRLLTNEKGESRISAEDFAIAFVNEVETPQYIHHRLTVAY